MTLSFRRLFRRNKSVTQETQTPKPKLLGGKKLTLLERLETTIPTQPTPEPTVKCHPGGCQICEVPGCCASCDRCSAGGYNIDLPTNSPPPAVNFLCNGLVYPYPLRKDGKFSEPCLPEGRVCTRWHTNTRVNPSNEKFKLRR